MVFRDNVAHSISGGFNGGGSVIYADPSVPEHKKCFEASHIFAYKCTDAGALANSVSKRVVLHSVTTVDCAIGAGA
jgi:hypothetical protein